MAADNQNVKPERRGGPRAGAGRKKGEVSFAKQDIGKMAREHAKVALKTLVDMAQRGPPATRVAASQALLDRGFGRSPQFINLEGDLNHKIDAIQFEIIDPKVKK